MFAVLEVSRLPSNLEVSVRNDILDFQLDEKSLLSLNGERVEMNFLMYTYLWLTGFRITERILSVIPNIESFRVVLHAIKLWARRMERRREGEEEGKGEGRRQG